MLEQELADTNETLSDQTCQNQVNFKIVWLVHNLLLQAICGAKLKCESEMGSLNVTLDEMMGEAKMSEDKAQRVMMDAAR